jgi:hypothetical protein
MRDIELAASVLSFPLFIDLTSLLATKRMDGSGVRNIIFLPVHTDGWRTSAYTIGSKDPHIL